MATSKNANALREQGESTNLNHLNNDNHNLNTVSAQCLKLQRAFEDRDYTKITLLDFFQLVEAKFLKPQTAYRLSSQMIEIGDSHG